MLSFLPFAGPEVFFTGEKQSNVHEEIKLFQEDDEDDDVLERNKAGMNLEETG